MVTHARAASALSLSLLLGCAATRPALRSPAASTEAPAVALSWGDTHAELTASDASTDEGRLARRYAIELSEGERVRLVMRSTALDSRLVVEEIGRAHV